MNTPPEQPRKLDADVLKYKIELEKDGGHRFYHADVAEMKANEINEKFGRQVARVEPGTKDRNGQTYLVKIDESLSE